MDELNKFNSLTEASKELNIPLAKLSKCCHNKQKTAGGFIFKFSE